MITIRVRYTCGLCDIVDAEVEVPARESEEEDLMLWMENMAGLLAADHVRRSPQCRPKKFKVVKIPLQNAAWVGGPALQ